MVEARIHSLAKEARRRWGTGMAAFGNQKQWNVVEREGLELHWTAERHLGRGNQGKGKRLSRSGVTRREIIIIMRSERLSLLGSSDVEPHASGSFLSRSVSCDCDRGLTLSYEGQVPTYPRYGLINNMISSRDSYSPLAHFTFLLLFSQIVTMRGTAWRSGETRR